MNQAHLIDGDFGWSGVNDRLHPSQLPAGMAASALNCMFDYGDARPRWAVNVGVWGHSSKLPGNPIAACRWYEPVLGQEIAVVITDDLRDEGGEDGGRGRAFAVRPGGEPIEIPLNGHDVWGSARLVPCRTGLLLLRHGNQRFYVPAANLSAGSATITTNVNHGLVDGDYVYLRDDGGVATPLQPDVRYKVDMTAAKTLRLLDGSSVAITIATVGVRFALEKDSDVPGPGGNGAEPLILQGAWSEASTKYSPAWEVGFASVPQSVACDVDHQGSLWLAQNHRFANGEAIELAASWDVTTPSDPTAIAAGTTLYAHPTDPHHFTLHRLVEDAMLGTNALVDSTVTAGGLTTSAAPDGYSGQPIVPLREAIAYKNRLVGINGQNNVAVSDPGDLLHFTPFTGALTLNIGNGDPLTTLIPLGSDSLMFASESQVLAITGLSVNDPAVWQAIEVTREYGCLAPLTAVQVGRDAWFLSRAGIISVAQTDYGLQQGTAVPVSQPISRKLDEVDWVRAGQSCAAWFQNKYICAVPLKGQDGAIKNNCLLVYNFLTQGWDHYWQGDGLNPICFFRLKVGKAERLCWLDADGSVKWFTEGWEDVGLTLDGSNYEYTSAAIQTELITRAYTAGAPRRKQWQEVEIVADTINPSTGLSCITEGVSQETDYRAAVTRDPAVFLTWNTENFNPATEPDRANLPYREDYSWVETDVEISPLYATYRNSKGNLTPVTSYAQTTWNVVPGAEYRLTAGATEAAAGQVKLFEWSNNSLGADDIANLTTLGETAVVTPTTSQVRLIINQAYTGQPVTATLEALGGITLPDDGAPADAHQTYHETIAVRERCRSVQIKLTNAQGSARWRACHLAGVAEKGDW